MRYDLQGLVDVRPSHSGMVKTKLQLEYKNLVTELMVNFGKKLEQTCLRWAERLANADFTINEIRAGIEYTVNNCDKLPSFSEFKLIIRNNAPEITRQESEKERQLEQQFQSLRNYTSQQKEQFLQHFSEEDLINSMRVWWKGVYGGDPSDYGMGLRFFMPIFFQDLVKGKLNLKKAIEIGLQNKVAS